MVALFDHPYEVSVILNNNLNKYSLTQLIKNVILELK